ncbi:MAG: HU family DNA-binding protein [Tannerella sp.]|jgi:nucleoid DNA-binding protein|nr:HU family DNA-binding protein [Tannerella sp.]
MDEKFSLYNMAEMLSERTGLGVPDMEKFLEELISIINDGIRKDRQIKVRGLGTFKIVLVKERESIHVNTGERIVISKHHKLTFVPEKELKDLANRPFSMFSPEDITDRPPKEGSLVTDMHYEDDDSDDDSDLQISQHEDAAPNDDTTLLLPPPAKEAPPQDDATVIQNRPETETPRTDEDTVLLPSPAPEGRPGANAPTVPPPAPQAEPQSQEDTVLLPPPVPKNKPDERATDEETTLLSASPAVPPSPPAPSAVNRNDETVILAKEIQGGHKQTVEENEKNETMSKKKKKKSLWPLYIILVVLLFILGGCIWYLLSDNSLPFFNRDRRAEIRGESFALPGDSIALQIAQEKARAAILPDSALSRQDTAATTTPDTNPAAAIATTPAATSAPPSSAKGNTVKRPDSKPATSSRVSQSSGGNVIAKVKMEAGQRLTLLALEYYGNKIFWVYIYEYNKSKIGTNPNVVPIGMEISIPAKSVYGIDAGNAASLDKARRRQAEIMSGVYY